MATAYPGALDASNSQLRTDISSTDDLDASGKEHDVMHVNVHGAAIALETKLGTGSSTPVNKAVLVGDGTGSSAWDTTPTIGGAMTVEGTITVSSGGLKLDNQDADANTLDSYEEGLWTATLTSTTSGSITINSGFDSMAYIRIGRMVFIQGTIELSSVSSPVGTLRLGGLPFVQANDLTDRADRGGGAIVTVTELSSASTDGVYCHGQVNVSYFDIIGGNGGTANQSLAGYVDASTKFVVSGCYYAAA